LVENIASDINAKKLYKKVKKMGSVVKILYPATNVSSSAAYVVYATEEEAKKAVKSLDNHTFHRQKISVKIVSKEV